MNPSTYSAPGSPVRSNSTGSSNNPPNPFAEAAPSRNTGPGNSSSGGASPPAPPQNPNQFLTRHDSMHGDDDAAPPAYSDEDGTYANLQRDVKQPVVMNPEGTSSSRAAPSSAPAPAPAPPAAPAPAPAASSPAENSRRPTSAYTVYDPADAYGGM